MVNQFWNTTKRTAMGPLKFSVFLLAIFAVGYINGFRRNDMGELDEEMDENEVELPRDMNDIDRDENDVDDESYQDSKDDENDPEDNDPSDDDDDRDDENAEDNNQTEEDGDDAVAEEQSADAVDPLCSKGMCHMGIQPIGCFYDPVVKDRPLPILLDSHRDRTSHAFHNVVFKWPNAEASIKRLACDCVKIAKKRGMTHFGLQHYGECWGSKTAAKDYAKHGESKHCVNGQYKPCKFGQFCVGKEHANYVYAINALTTVPCHTKYEKVGCFHDPVITSKRPLPELLVSHRDTTSHAYNGKLIDWRNFRASLQELLCICAEKAKKKGHKYIGVQYYGECWSGPGVTYNNYGPSHLCVNTDFQKCDAKSTCPCTGAQYSNFVYKLL